MPGGYRFRDPLEDLLYEALCLNYWGAKAEAIELLMETTEKVLARDVQKETQTASAAGTSFPLEDDIEYREDLGADLYPWDGWQLDGRN